MRMNITLGNEFERRITEKVNSGLYTSASEVIRDGLRLLFERDEWRKQQVALLQQEVAAGLAALDAGTVSPLSAMDIFKQAQTQD